MQGLWRSALDWGDVGRPVAVRGPDSSTDPGARMSSEGTAPNPPPPIPAMGPNLRYHRLAEQVADNLRNRILHGDLDDGMLLPKENELRQSYPVSKPALREAMRILETEGLVTVRRGNVGGAIVHRPTAANVAYTLGTVLASRGVGTTAVAAALLEVEPACAALCARRNDRRTAIVPQLEQLHAEALANVEDLEAVTSASRRFHEALVNLCGNEALIIMAGALETLWSSHESNWARSVTQLAAIPIKERLAVLDEHQRVIDLIAAGNADRAREAAALHLLTAQTYPESRNGQLTIDPTMVRDRGSGPRPDRRGT